MLLIAAAHLRPARTESRGDWYPCFPLPCLECRRCSASNIDLYKETSRLDSLVSFDRALQDRKLLSGHVDLQRRCQQKRAAHSSRADTNRLSTPTRFRLRHTGRSHSLGSEPLE